VYHILHNSQFYSEIFSWWSHCLCCSFGAPKKSIGPDFSKVCVRDREREHRNIPRDSQLFFCLVSETPLPFPVSLHCGLVLITELWGIQLTWQLQHTHTHTQRETLNRQIVSHTCLTYAVIPSVFVWVSDVVCVCLSLQWCMCAPTSWTWSVSQWDIQRISLRSMSLSIEDR